LFPFPTLPAASGAYDIEHPVPLANVVVVKQMTLQIVLVKQTTKYGVCWDGDKEIRRHNVSYT
jgi:hypothetical protein